MRTKITKDGLYMVDLGKDFTLRCFKDEETFKEWEKYTNENGHDMISFYKIKKMISRHSPWTEAEWDAK